MKKIIFGLMVFLCSFSLLSCKKETPDDPDNPGSIIEPEDPNNPQPSDPYVQPEGYPYPQTHLDDGKERIVQGLTINDGGHNIIYLGDRFTAEGYSVFMTYLESDHTGTNLPSRTAMKIEDFSFDDTKVNYQREGTYTVTFYGRIRTDFNLAAAKQNDSFSCEKIASFYADGYGCPQSSELAVFYYSKACELGNVHAMLDVAKRYKIGKGVPQSVKEAIYWWLKAAPHSHEAQMEMADCYLSGTGVRQDYAQGMNWLRKAAVDNPEAMLKMAELSLNPLPGAERSESEAKIWWSRAAALGNSLAMYKLGVCYEDAIGAVTPNYNEAYKWYRLASQNGNDDATEACKRFTKSMFGNVKLKSEK